MAETIWWCKTHQMGHVGKCDYDTTEMVLSAPGELVDPAKVDYEAAKRVMRSWLVEDNDAPLLSAVRLAVDAALGVGEPAEEPDGGGAE